MQLIVLGMHRSGTSSITRLLNLAGAYFGPEGIATEPNVENPKGFWERRDVRAVCDALLEAGGYDWWRVSDFRVEQIPDAAVAQQLDTFRKIVLDLDAHRPWVVKEPRLCLLLPLLRGALEAAVYVHVSREPLEIAGSLAARNGFGIPVGIALWEVYTVNALAASAGEPRVLVSYGDLVADPVATTAQVLEDLAAAGVQGLHLPTEREITSFVSPQLHRQHRVASERRSYLNEHQAALADRLDRARLPDIGEPLAVSDGAVATLQLFEESRRLDAALTRADETHRDIEAGIRAQADAARHELEAAHHEAERQLAARADEQRRDAAEAVAAASRRVQALKRSGAVRAAIRLSGARGRLRGRRRRGVDIALGAALEQLRQARAVLERASLPAPRPAISTGADEPPSLEQLQRERRTARARGDRTKVAVIAWDVGHNPYGRAHLLADLLREQYDVGLWGAQFDRYGSDVWRPLMTSSIPLRRYRGADFPSFLGVMKDAARRIDADVIYVSKARFPSLGVGVLAKELWNRSLVVDVDDFEPAFFENPDPVDTGDLVAHREDPDLSLPFGRLWTLACDSVVSYADQVTVSNPELEQRYGGTIVPHARDERVFDPRRYDREVARRRLGLRDSDRLLLVGGTPRAHKGIGELVAALDALGDDRARVAVFGTRELEALRPQLGTLERWIVPLPYRSFDELPQLLAATDVACALQSPTHPVSRYQMPAKVTDAMAMGVPCLVTAVPPLQPLIDKDLVAVHDSDTPLHEGLRALLDGTEEVRDRAARAREYFLENLSYAAVRPIAATAIEQYLDNPPPLASPLASLVATADQLFAGRRPRTPTAAKATVPVVPRRPIPAGTVYDLVMFWKQNDTGIYGRRQDMFLKYLERSGRFHTIVHFDHPMSAQALARVARRSVTARDQNRFVLRQTLARLARRSDSSTVRYRTFVYASSPASHRLGLPHRNDHVDYVRHVFEREGIGPRPIVFWVYPTNLFMPELLDSLGPDIVVADVVDDNRTWYAPGTPAHEQLERNYEEILRRSDVVLANCEPVATSMRQFAHRVDVVTNACELPNGRRRGPRPHELSGLLGPIIGYAGNLSDRIDLDLLDQVARARRDWTFVFVGSAHLDRSATRLAREPNVRLIGTRPYERTKDIIEHFDVALIPHLDNEMTRSMNPLKAYVYCSLGVPIVSTRIANLDDLSAFVTMADDAPGFIAAIERALQSGRTEPNTTSLSPHSWDTRVERVLELIDDVVRERSARRD